VNKNLEELFSLYLPHGEDIRKELVRLSNSGDKNSEMSCYSCAGTCCTFQCNSMSLTPLEALELLRGIIESKLSIDEVKERCKEAVSHYGLNQELYIKRQIIRKRYTCPLFKETSLGCPIVPKYKPYGCLAFNPTGETDRCYSDQSLLKKVEEINADKISSVNHKISSYLSLDWEKKNLPMALLEIIEKSQ